LGKKWNYFNPYSSNLCDKLGSKYKDREVKMNARSKLFVLFALFALTLAACAPASVQAGQGTPPSQPSTTPTEVASGGTPEPRSIGNITLANDGQTVALRVNDTFLLDLGEGYQWDLHLDNMSVISRIPYISVIRGAQGVYQAHLVGIATLTANGEPDCRQSTPACAIPSVSFTLHIEVQP